MIQEHGVCSERWVLWLHHKAVFTFSQVIPVASVMRFILHYNILWITSSFPHFFMQLLLTADTNRKLSLVTSVHQ
jgi:hypothetical protein